MFCSVLMVSALLGPQLPGPPSSICPEDCIVNFGNGLCAIRVEDCATNTSTVMYGDCFSDPCGCDGNNNCNCDSLNYPTPVLQPAYPGHDGPPMYTNHDLTSPPSLTVGTVGNVVGYDDYDVTSLGTASVPGTGGNATEYYAMFKVTHTVFSPRYIGMRLSDATSGTPVDSNMNLQANKDGDVVERALLFTYSENGSSHTYWFHVVGPVSGSGANDPGNGGGDDPGTGGGGAPAPAAGEEAGKGVNTEQSAADESPAAVEPPAGEPSGSGDSP